MRVRQSADSKKCHLFHHKENEGLEGFTVFTLCVIKQSFLIIKVDLEALFHTSTNLGK